METLFSKIDECQSKISFISDLLHEGDVSKISERSNSGIAAVLDGVMKLLLDISKIVVDEVQESTVVLLDELVVCQSKISLLLDFFCIKDISEINDQSKSGLTMVLDEVMNSLSNMREIIELEDSKEFDKMYAKIDDMDKMKVYHQRPYCKERNKKTGL